MIALLLNALLLHYSPEIRYYGIGTEIRRGDVSMKAAIASIQTTQHATPARHGLRWRAREKNGAHIASKDRRTDWRLTMTGARDCTED